MGHFLSRRGTPCCVFAISWNPLGARPPATELRPQLFIKVCAEPFQVASAYAYGYFLPRTCHLMMMMMMMKWKVYIVYAHSDDVVVIVTVTLVSDICIHVCACVCVSGWHSDMCWDVPSPVVCQRLWDRQHQHSGRAQSADPLCGDVSGLTRTDFHSLLSVNCVVCVLIMC